MDHLKDMESDLRKLFFRAFVISLLIHILGFGCWKWGQKHGWWKNSGLPRWLQVMETKLIRSPVIKKTMPLAALQPKFRQAPTLFVDVDPSLAEKTPPKNAKYYGAANTTQASRVKKEADMPKIEGHQDKVLKTTDESRSAAQPPKPSPPKEVTPKPAPKPVEVTPKPTPEPKPEPAPIPKPEPKAPQPEPKLAQTHGDTIIAKPQETPQQGTASTQQVKPKPITKPSPQKAKTNPQSQVQAAVPHRPRTLEEARKKAGMLGEKMRMEGGSHRLAMESTLDVMRSASGDYDREFVDAVQQRWFKLLDERGATIPGKVVLEFRLHSDGRISDMKMPHNEVGELLGIICQKAVLDPAPYRRWPTEMRREINADYRDIKFTFYYLNH